MSTRSSLRKAEARVGPHRRQRVAALVALLAETAGAVALVVLIVLRPLFAVGVAAVSLALLGCIFAALVTTKPLRRVLATGGAAGFAKALLGLVLFWGERAELAPLVAPIALILLGGGLLLGRYALKRPPPLVEVDDVPSEDRVARHPVLIINPRSGDGKAERFDLAARARELGIKTVVMAPDDDLEELARRAIADGADVLGMAGGDGSQALVLSIAVEHDVAFVCIPSGTRNHFALDLGLDRNDPGLALAAFVNGEERPVDFGLVNDRVFVNNVALGVYAAIVDQEGYREAKVSTTLELLPTLIEREGPWYDLQFDVPEHGHVDGTALLLVSNNPYAIGSSVNQRASLAGGELGVITINPERVSDLVAITMAAAAGRPDSAKAFWSWSTPRLTVESAETEIVAGIDGEKVSLTPPLEFRIVPDTARVLVPPGTRVGLDEQQAHESGWTYAGLLEVAFNLKPDHDAPRTLPAG
jgi:diacylglycerol kinase family enzyme